MKTIVALVDFSDVTAKVVEQSQHFAKAFDAQLVILHAVERELVAVDLGLVSPTIRQAPTERKVEADYHRLIELRDASAASGIKVSAHQLEDATVDTLIEECARLKADLIVLGSHHHSAIYNWFVGTFANDVLKIAACPVLVVPAER